MKPYIIALTGGIACGKTAVGNILQERGAYIIDADVLSRRVVEPGTEGFKRLGEAFPSVCAGGTLDRRALKDIVFRDENSLKTLNGIMFPRIRAAAEAEMNACGKETVVLIVPLLFESGYDDMADVIVTVSAPAEKRIERLIERDNVTAEMAVNILSAQMSDAEREARSDVVIRNDGSMKELRDRATMVYNEILERAI